MCLYHPKYTTLCDKRISNQYKALSLKDEFRSVELAQIKSETAILSVQNFEGWRVTFDRKPTEIRKEYLDLPMKFKIDELTDYPPKFLITAHPKAAAKKSVTPQLTVQGLDRELTFPVIMDCSGFSLKPSHRPPHFQGKASATGCCDQILQFHSIKHHLKPTWITVWLPEDQSCKKNPPFPSPTTTISNTSNLTSLHFTC